MITEWIDRFIREPLHQLFLRVAVETRKKQKRSITTRGATSIFKSDIHIPPFLVAIFTPLIAVPILLIGMGWSWGTVLSLTTYVVLSESLLIFFLQRNFSNLLKDDEAMVLLASVCLFFIALSVALKHWNVPYLWMPIPAGSLLIGLLLDPWLAVLFSIVIAFGEGLLQSGASQTIAITLVGSLAAAAASVYIRSQKDFISAGAAISLSEIFALVVIHFIQEPYAVRLFLTHCLAACGNGLLSSIFALGCLPFLELLFQRVTPMRLKEFTDFNHPLLKRLMVEAPGTYHHSLMMATISEAAARAIGGNELLTRVGAYFHDIGKLVKPNYFIENQGGLTNPHGNLAPHLSSLVVIQHVKEGVALARAAKLPEEIVNFIPMHHGTSRIEYFYSQAKDDAEENFYAGAVDSPDVEEGNYRYPGPRPQTKETAILMLADSVEAAARTIEEPTHQRFQDLVRKLINRKMEDGQLADSPLTFQDLAKIENAFVKTLTSIYHSRIEYPEDHDSEK